MFLTLFASGINDILHLCKERHYQVACNKYFELKHNQPSPNIITHPNQYFVESMNLSQAKDGKSAGKKQSKAHNGPIKMEVDGN